MEVVITPEGIIQVAAVISALGVILTLVYKIFKSREDNKQLKEDIEESKKERGVLCYAVLACLDGLTQLGCNGNVTKAKDALEKHLNQTAHRS